MNNLKTTLLVTCSLSIASYLNILMYQVNNNEPSSREINLHNHEEPSVQFSMDAIKQKDTLEEIAVKR